MHRVASTKNQTEAPTTHDNSELFHVEIVPSTVRFSQSIAMLYVFKDNEAVMKMIIKGRGPTMKHVSRTHRVALDWLFDRISLDPKIQIRYIDTTHQLADILTKGNFTRDEWDSLLFCSTSAFSALSAVPGISAWLAAPKRRRRECRNRRKRKELWQNQDQRR